MSNAAPNAEPNAAGPRSSRQYVVVARRYRPKTFEELIGQEHIAQALSGAIATNRVGHAYLFTGARGVGKTSTARILAKALNCQHGPTATPCNECDVCRSISSGDDVDVLEIDGASNRGIDEIRQLRQNVNVRPSRSRFKIYIIDEVHMLTREAFNALLKTLEEPPEHVKFIFCTTEPTKIPITILSRCQRFDFAGILTRSIAQRLRQIVEAEGVEAEPEALEVLARRAAGSMRDSQSLLEQLLAFAPSRITVEAVHGMLGTAGDERLAALVGHLVSHNAAGALADLDAAVQEGIDVAQLLEQLMGYFRDCMLAAIGCPAESFLYVSPAAGQRVVEAGKQLGLTAVLAVLQILDQTQSRLRTSTQARILAELAVVRICHLEELDALPDLITQLYAGVPLAGPGATPAGAPGRPAAAPNAPKKNVDVAMNAAASPPVAADGYNNSSAGAEAIAPARPCIELNPDNAAEVWSQALARLSGMVVEQARRFDRVVASAPDRLMVSFRAGFAIAKSVCQRPEQVARFEQALAEVTGRPVRVEFSVEEDGSGAPRPQGESIRPISPHQRMLEVAKHPLVRRAGELFGAQPVRVDDPPGFVEEN